MLVILTLLWAPWQLLWVLAEWMCTGGRVWRPYLRLKAFSCCILWEVVQTAGLMIDKVPAHVKPINKKHFLNRHHLRRAVHWVTWDYYVISCRNAFINSYLLLEWLWELALANWMHLWLIQSVEYGRNYIMTPNHCTLKTSQSCLTLRNSMQAPLSMRFSRQGCWRELPFPAPGDFPDVEIEPTPPALAGGFFYHWATWEVHMTPNPRSWKAVKLLPCCAGHTLWHPESPQ